MNFTCIFGTSHPGRDCDHAQCKIIRTIKKINKPIFKKRRPARRERVENLWSDDSSSLEQVMAHGSMNKMHEGEFRQSQKTISGFWNIEGRSRLDQLQQQIKSLKSEMVFMKNRLEDAGIL